MKSDENWDLVLSLASEEALARYLSLTQLDLEHRSYYATTYSCKDRQHKCPLRVKVIDPGKMDVSWVPDTDRAKVAARCYAVYVNGRHTHCSFDSILHPDKFATESTVSTTKKRHSASNRSLTNISDKDAQRACKSASPIDLQKKLTPGLRRLSSVKRRLKRRARDGLDYLSTRMKAVARDRKRKAMQIAQQKMNVSDAVVNNPSSSALLSNRSKGGKKRLLSKETEHAIAVYIRRLDNANLSVPPQFIRGFVSELAMLMGHQRDSIMSTGWYEQFAIRHNLSHLKTPHKTQDSAAALQMFTNILQHSEASIC